MKKFLVQSGLLAVALVSITSSMALAKEFNVNSELDLIDQNLGDGVCQTKDGNCSLRAAVMESNALLGKDTILLPSGEYNLVIGSRNEDEAAEGDLDISDDLIIIGESPENTVITGNKHKFGVIQIHSSRDKTPKVTISQVSLKEGHGSGVIFLNGAVLYNQGVTLLDDVNVEQGSQRESAIYNSNKLTIIRSTINNNKLAIQNEGVLLIEDSELNNNSNSALTIGSGTVEISRSVFNYNMDSAITAKSSSDINLTIRESKFTKNKSEEHGGAIYLDFSSSTSTASVSDSTFSGNTAANSGGAIYIYKESPLIVASTLPIILQRVTLENNEASWGGGIFCQGKAWVLESTITGNKSKGSGGGAFFDGCLMRYSLVAENSASKNGGGIRVRKNAIIENSTISGNSSNEDGGGLYSFIEKNTNVELVNVTIANNNTDLGVGSNIYNFDSDFNDTGSLRLTNSLIANPKNGDNCVGRIVSLGGNLASDNSCGLDSSSDKSDVDANVMALADNGGNTKTHALKVGSPAIDNGDLNVCKNMPALDQRYYKKDDSRCDSGAYEANSEKAPVSNISFTVAEKEIGEDLSPLTINVNRSGSYGLVSIEVIDTNMGTADSLKLRYQNDYMKFKPTQLEWLDGEHGEKSFQILLKDDARIEGIENIELKLQNAQGSSQIGNIQKQNINLIDNEANLGTLFFEIAPKEVQEGDGNIKFIISRLYGNYGEVSVDVVSGSNGDTATAQEDYNEIKKTLTMPNGTGSMSFVIEILDDTKNESNEYFSVTLQNATGGADIVANNSVQVTIQDNDVDVVQNSPPQSESESTQPNGNSQVDSSSGTESSSEVNNVAADESTDNSSNSSGGGSINVVFLLLLFFASALQIRCLKTVRLC